MIANLMQIGKFAGKVFCLEEPGGTGGGARLVREVGGPKSLGEPETPLDTMEMCYAISYEIEGTSRIIERF